MTRYDIPVPKPPKKPNCLDGLAGSPPYPKYGPKPPPKPRTPKQQAADARAAAEYQRRSGTVFRQGEIDLHRAGDDAWVLEYAQEYATNLTRTDLRRLRDNLNKELGDG